MSDILIIEDNRDIAEGLRRNLEIEGFSVDLAHNAAEGLARIREQPPELIVLDLMLPDDDGFRVLRRLRDEGFEMPVLILSARASETEKVRGFRIGADDYVTKPFGLKELMARIDALFRRRRRTSDTPAAKTASPRETFGEISVDFGSRQVWKRGEVVALRPKEFELLEALIQRAERVVSRRELLERVWGYDADVQTRTVDTHMVELRRKLEDDAAEPKHIITVRKAGYLLKR